MTRPWTWWLNKDTVCIYLQKHVRHGGIYTFARSAFPGTFCKHRFTSKGKILKFIVFLMKEPNNLYLYLYLLIRFLLPIVVILTASYCAFDSRWAEFYVSIIQDSCLLCSISWSFKFVRTCPPVGSVPIPVGFVSPDQCLRPVDHEPFFVLDNNTLHR